MRTIALSLCLGLALATPTAVAAQSAPVHHDGVGHDGANKIPLNILDGLDALRRDHPDDAEAAWLKDSTFSPDGSSSAMLRNFRAHDGEYQGFELIGVQDVTQRTRVIYLALNYDRQPHFAKFVVYHTEKEWIVLQLDLNVDLTAMQTSLANTPR